MRLVVADTAPMNYLILIGQVEPDAVNIAIAQRTGATLVTFDEKMIASARALGTAVTMM